MNRLQLLGIAAAGLLTFTLLLGAARDVRDSSMDIVRPTEVLYEFPTTTQATDGNCLNTWLTGGTAGSACTVVSEAQYTMPRDAHITELKVVVQLAGDAGTYDCTFTLIDGAQADLTGQVDLVLTEGAITGTIETQAQNITVSEDDILSLEVNETDGACTGTIDPIFTAVLYGKFLD